MATSPTQQLAIIDTDIHEVADVADLVPYLDPRFRHYITEAGWTPDRILP
jgi:hypothetical protein